jgi:hypothetical protein
MCVWRIKNGEFVVGLKCGVISLRTAITSNEEF